jgi:precorrin-3B methylase
MLIASSVSENETLRKISGGDLALFAQNTAAFLRAASVAPRPQIEVVPAKAPVAPVPAPAVEKKD